MIGLLDCNNFYVSCERLFNPKLLEKPVIILSNNDGCVISRSEEAKQIGVKMGEPFFKLKQFIMDNNISVLSSNYSFYGDISNRIMNILKKNLPIVEVYSIDEAFFILDLKDERDDFCHKLAKRILKWKPKISLEDLVSEMIEEDKTLAAKEYFLKEKGFKVNKPSE